MKIKEFIIPFIHASQEVFKTMVFCDIGPKEPQEILFSERTHGDVSAIIGLNGEFKNGDETLYYRSAMAIIWPMSVYIKVSNSMLSEEHKEYNESLRDVGREIANMVMGNAKKELVKLGYTTSMDIPSLVVGRNHSIAHLSETNAIKVDFDSNLGPMTLELSLKI